MSKLDKMLERAHKKLQGNVVQIDLERVAGTMYAFVKITDPWSPKFKRWALANEHNEARLNGKLFMDKADAMNHAYVIERGREDDQLH